MLRAAILVLGLLSAALASAAPSAQARWPVLHREARILAFGDSLTDGVGGTGENYPQRLSRLIGREVVNSGLPGETTAQGLQRLAQVLQREHAALLILCLGINDFLQNVPEVAIRANLVAMLRVAADAGVPVLLLAVAKPGSSQAHPLYAEAAAEGGAWLESQALASVLSNAALKADLVHPNREGYRALANALADRLRAEGALASE